MERSIKLIQPVKLAGQKLLRVAAYARVSVDKDTMKHSLAAQISYYSSYIQQHGDWEFAGIYADEAYSGTKDNRPRFVQMLKDCREGKIDRIITKSISRFARNTLTLLKTIRELRGLGIGVYFEEQNIDTLTEAGELMITLLASQAQEESLATSENCKWRIRKMFEEGYTTSFNMVGYRVENGLVVLVPEEAETVRRVFDLYLAGYGKQAIANILREEGVPSRTGGEWNQTTIFSMLRNEKYAGDLLLQKSYITDHLTKASVKNKGERPQYFIKDDHEPIIDRDTFDKVQREIARRAEKFAHPQGRYTVFSSLIRCGICGKSYRRKITEARVIWTCSTYNTRGKKYCASNSIPESTLEEACALALGLSKYDDETAGNRITCIDALPDHMLVFHLDDGTERRIEWSYPSRSEGWTEARRRRAAENTRRHYAKTGS